MQLSPAHRRVRRACYATNVSMAMVGNLPPVLFLTFRDLYGISYTMLGLLVLINFSTQLIIDLIFSFFSHRINIPRAVRLTPVLSVIGFAVYAVWPWLFPGAVFPGLVIGTIIFSASGGFNEVLISPVIAALPADDPDREMSRLHSIYAWGVVGIILFATLFLLIFGGARWQWLVLSLLVVPLYAAGQFAFAEIPPMETPERASGVLALLRTPILWLCVAAIFFGGAAECTMAQWSSSYLEQAVGLPKVWGDIFGVALFGMMLGMGRTLYAKAGRQIERVLLAGACGAAVCYLVAALVGIPVIGLFACAFTGFCTSMLWPGSLIAAADRIPQGGVFIYAMMAAGGDLGASIGPQLVGFITDAAIASPAAVSFAAQLGLAPEQLGMKAGILCGALFPLAAIPVMIGLRKTAVHKEDSACG